MSIERDSIREEGRDRRRKGEKRQAERDEKEKKKERVGKQPRYASFGVSTDSMGNLFIWPYWGTCSPGRRG